MSAVRKIVLGTRGSDLALTQARMTQQALREKCGVETSVEIVSTTGDESGKSKAAERSPNDARAGRKGLFTAELERALIDGRIDLAVHSAKDLPSEMDVALTIGAVLPRGAVEDLLITKTGAPFASLRLGATIATGSIRRQRQLQWVRPDCVVFPVRGNVPTRLRKLSGSDWDGLILARAGLERLGLALPEFSWEGEQFYAHCLPIERFVPAAGQGSIALQVRSDETSLVAAVNDAETHLCLRAEREFLRLLQGDCDSPVGAYARKVDAELELSVQVFTEDTAPRMAQARGSEPERTAMEVFRRMEQHGRE